VASWISVIRFWVFNRFRVVVSWRFVAASADQMTELRQLYSGLDSFFILLMIGVN
jgi:hypothetical protein